MDRSCLSVVNVVLNRAGVFEMQRHVSFTEGHIKDSVHDMVQSRSLLKRSGSSYVRCVRFGRLMKRNSDAFALSMSPHDGWGKHKELDTLLHDSGVLHGTPVSFNVLLIETTYFFINNHTKSTAFHPPLLPIRRTVSEQAIPPVRQAYFIDEHQFSWLYDRKVKQASR